MRTAAALASTVIHSTSTVCQPGFLPCATSELTQEFWCMPACQPKSDSAFAALSQSRLAVCCQSPEGLRLVRECSTVKNTHGTEMQMSTAHNMHWQSHPRHDPDTQAAAGARPTPSTTPALQRHHWRCCVTHLSPYQHALSRNISLWVFTMCAGCGDVVCELSALAQSCTRAPHKRKPASSV